MNFWRQKIKLEVNLTKVRAKVGKILSGCLEQRQAGFSKSFGHKTGKDSAMVNEVWHESQ